MFLASPTLQNGHRHCKIGIYIECHLILNLDSLTFNGNDSALKYYSLTTLTFQWLHFQLRCLTILSVFYLVPTLSIFFFDLMVLCLCAGVKYCASTPIVFVHKIEFSTLSLFVKLVLWKFYIPFIPNICLHSFQFVLFNICIICIC
jgi:hypothetical protein